MKAACDKHDRNYYPKYKKWCDEYFYLPYRDEPRGAGGVFYDNLDDDWNGGAFTRNVGLAFKDVYADIVRQRMGLPWTEENVMRNWCVGLVNLTFT